MVNGHDNPIKIRWPKSEIDGELKIKPIGITRAKAWSGETLADIVASKEVAVASLDLRIASDSPAGDQVEFCSHKIAVRRVHTITRAGSAGHSPARSAIHAVKTVMRICEPK